MPHLRSLRAALPALLLFVSALMGCGEDAIIGTSVVPVDDSFNTTSVEVDLTARSVYDDSAITAFLDLTTVLIGTAQGIGTVSTDPYGGRVTAGTYFSVVPPSGGFDIDTAGLRIDSVVLVLPYLGFSWGDTSNSAPGQRWSVYRVTDDLTPDTPYTSNRRLSTAATKLGSELVYKADYSRPRTIDGAARPAHLRLRLDTAVLSPLLRNHSTKLGSAAGMREFLKGFYVKPDDGQTASTLAYFRFSANTGLYERPAMFVYYQTPARDSSLAVFPFSVDSSAAFTTVERAYGGSPAFNLLFGGDDSRPQDQLLLQNQPGAAIDVKMYGLRGLLRAVYPKAQIILTKIDTAQSDKFFEPSRIFPTGVDADGSTYSILDRVAGVGASEAFIDGTRRTVTIGGVTVTQYVVNVPREFQRAIKAGEDTLHLRLNGVSGFPGAYRLIAGGRGHGRWRIDASVAYTRQ